MGGLRIGGWRREARLLDVVIVELALSDVGKHGGGVGAAGGLGGFFAPGDGSGAAKSHYVGQARVGSGMRLKLAESGPAGFRFGSFNTTRPPKDALLRSINLAET